MTTRTRHKLNDRAIKAATMPGRLHDGGGLYFQITARGSRSWEYRFERHGKRRTMGLGAYPAVSLSRARELHKAAAALVTKGVDPIAARGLERQTAAVAAAMTVKQACEDHLVAQRARFETQLHVNQLRARLVAFVYPTIGQRPIATIGLADIKQCLSPIWESKHETALRVRRHLEDVINWAIAEGIRVDETNPTEVKRLRYSLPFGISKAKHFASLDYEQAPAFFAELRAYEGVKARALEFVMLTAVRVGDVTGGGKDHSEPMKWSHVDLDAKLWTIPDTKMGRPHVVPLSDAALAVLEWMRGLRDRATDYVFPGAKRGSVIDDSTLRYLLKDMGYAGIATTHGMRATFRTFASEMTAFEKDVIEASLAHAQGELDAAYHRGSYLQKRRALMERWANYLTGEARRHGNRAAKGSLISLDSNS
jgi:integrase